MTLDWHWMVERDWIQTYVTLNIRQKNKDNTWVTITGQCCISTQTYSSLEFENWNNLHLLHDAPLLCLVPHPKCAPTQPKDFIQFRARSRFKISQRIGCLIAGSCPLPPTSSTRTGPTPLATLSLRSSSIFLYLLTDSVLLYEAALSPEFLISPLGYFQYPRCVVWVWRHHLCGLQG